METTRHFTATAYVVNNGATLLHRHKRLNVWLPPGGHIDRDELPHEAVLREVTEETGLDVTLVSESDDIESATVRPLPQPEHVHLADINAHNGDVGHQHIDLIYYAGSDTRTVSPESGEVTAANWEWYTPEQLERERNRLEPNVIEIGKRAIQTVGEESY